MKPAWLERVEVEYRDLSDKVRALDGFIKAQAVEQVVDDAELYRLRLQLAAMADYGAMLALRIAAATKAS